MNLRLKAMEVTGKTLDYCAEHGIFCDVEAAIDRAITFAKTGLKDKRHAKRMMQMLSNQGDATNLMGSLLWYAAGIMSKGDEMILTAILVEAKKLEQNWNRISKQQ